MEKFKAIIIAKDVKIKFGEHVVSVLIARNQDGNLEVVFDKKDLKTLAPKGYDMEGYDSAISFYPW